MARGLQDIGVKKTKQDTFIDDYADAIAVVIQALTPLVLGGAALGCGTYLMVQAIRVESGNRFIAASSTAGILFGTGMGGALGAAQPGTRERRKRNINMTGEENTVVFDDDKNDLK